MSALDELWPTPPTEPVLSGNEVHVWCARLDQPQSVVQRLAQTLSADEYSRAERFYFARHSRRFIVGRGVLRMILGGYLRRAPRQLQFRYGPNGKPALQAEGLKGHTLEFNLSHAESLALYAVALNRRVGVDIEGVQHIAEAEQIAERFFTRGECASLRALPEGEMQQTFFRYWTRKEAYLKATGTGLSQPLNRIDVSCSEEEPRWRLVIEEDRQEALRWSCADLQPAQGHHAAIVVEGGPPRLRRWRWAAPRELDVSTIAEFARSKGVTPKSIVDAARLG